MAVERIRICLRPEIRAAGEEIERRMKVLLGGSVRNGGNGSPGFSTMISELIAAEAHRQGIEIRKPEDSND